MVMRLACLLVALIVTSPANAIALKASDDDEGVTLHNALDEAAVRAREIFGPDPTCPRRLDAPQVVVPVVDDDRLAGYAFIVPRICLKRSDAFQYMTRQHILIDQLVRAAHRAPITVAGDGQLDKAAAHAAMLEATGAVINPADIDRLDLLGEDVRFMN